jgi:hypothetical protein
MSTKNMQPRLITLQDGTSTWVLCEVCPPSKRRFPLKRKNPMQSGRAWTNYTARCNAQDAKEE